MVIEKPNYPPFGPMATRDLTDITDEIVHHSAGALDETPLYIFNQHKAQGWAGIGYHFVIDPKGTIYQGRFLTEVPAAAEDDNTHSVDICLIGNFQDSDVGYTGPPTEQQIDSLEELSIYVHKECPNIVRTIGHRDVAMLFDDPSVATACPGNRLYSLLGLVKSTVWNTLHPKTDHF